jgi:hypothetical protein
MATTKKESFPTSFGTFDAVVYAEPMFNNERDMNERSFIVKNDPYIVIKWCRKNFGERGDGWNFYKTTKGYVVTITSSKLLTMWQLWQE